MIANDHLAPFIERVPELARVTPDALLAALDGFPLQCPHGIAWLARAIQGALLVTMPFGPIGCEQVSGYEPLQPSKTAIRNAAKDLKRKTEALLAGISKHRQCVEQMAGLSVEKHLWEALETLSELAAMNGEPPRWQQKVARDIRTSRAELLAVVFDLAFGRAATVNTWPDRDGGPWPDFYQRVMKLAFGETAPPDLIEVLKKARRKMLADKKRFGSDIRGILSPGTIPEYPT